MVTGAREHDERYEYIYIHTGGISTHPLDAFGASLILFTAGADRVCDSFSLSSFPALNWFVT